MSARTAAILHPRFRAQNAKAPGSVVSSNVLLAIVNARGVIDAGSVAPFAYELGHAVEAGATKILVDLTQVDEVTTACLNALLAVRQRLVASGGLIAVALSPWIGRQFEALGLGRRFLLAADRAEAARLLGLVDGGTPRAGAPAPRHAHAA
jgi:anti-anti-sigma regulatory factor